MLKNTTDYDLARKVLQEASLDDAALEAAADAVSRQSTDFFLGIEHDMVAHGAHKPSVEAVLARAAFAAPLSWSNWGENRTNFPARMIDLAEATIDAIRVAVADAAARGGRVRCVGSGHSFSDVVHADDVLLYRSNRPYASDQPLLSIPTDLWRDDLPERETLVRIACNATIGELNAALAAQHAPLAFNNLGSAILQTLAGAVATSTHGSGSQLGPIGNDVVSILIVDQRGDLIQIEPAHGITDPEKFAKRFPEGERRLVQSDRAFHAYMVSLGCMGVSVEMTVRVRTAFLLCETREVSTWGDLRKRLADGEFEWVRLHRDTS